MVETNVVVYLGFNAQYLQLACSMCCNAACCTVDILLPSLVYL